MPFCDDEKTNGYSVLPEFPSTTENILWNEYMEGGR
jgi:hypothetical protein